MPPLFAPQDTVYAAPLPPLLPHLLRGGAATVFAYGQTGSGKTCTMAGHNDDRRADGNAKGMYALAAEGLMAGARAHGLQASASFYEVYQGQARSRVHLPLQPRLHLALTSAAGPSASGA